MMTVVLIYTCLTPDLHFLPLTCIFSPYLMVSLSSLILICSLFFSYNYPWLDVAGILSLLLCGPIFTLPCQPDCVQVAVPFALFGEVGGYVFPEPVECTDWRSVPQRTMPPLFIQAPWLSRNAGSFEKSNKCILFR